MIMTDDLNAQFRALTEALATQGEDKDEMEYWADIFPDLPEEKQTELLTLFQEELQKLKSIP